MPGGARGARTSRQPGHFQVNKVVRQVIGCSAVKEPGHLEVRKSSSQVTFFPQKSGRPFFVAALKTQAANAADCFTVNIKQIKRSDMVTFFYFLFTLLPKQSKSSSHVI